MIKELNDLQALIEQDAPKNDIIKEIQNIHSFLDRIRYGAGEISEWDDSYAIPINKILGYTYSDGLAVAAEIADRMVEAHEQGWNYYDFGPDYEEFLNPSDDDDETDNEYESEGE